MREIFDDMAKIAYEELLGSTPEDRPTVEELADIMFEAFTLDCNNRFKKATDRLVEGL